MYLICKEITSHYFKTNININVVLIKFVFIKLLQEYWAHFFCRKAKKLGWRNIFVNWVCLIFFFHYWWLSILNSFLFKVMIQGFLHLIRNFTFEFKKLKLKYLMTGDSCRILPTSKLKIRWRWVILSFMSWYYWYYIKSRQILFWEELKFLKFKAQLDKHFNYVILKF